MVTNCDRCGQMLVAGKCKRCEAVDARPRGVLERFEAILESRREERRRFAAGVRTAVSLWAEQMSDAVANYEVAALESIDEKAYAKLTDDDSRAAEASGRAEEAVLQMLELLDKPGRVREAIERLPEFGTRAPTRPATVVQIARVPAPPAAPPAPPPPLPTPIRTAEPTPVLRRWPRLFDASESTQIIIVGGAPSPEKVEWLRRETGRDVEWIGSSGGGHGRTFIDKVIGRVRAGTVAAVVVCEQLCGMQAAQELRREADRHHVPFALASTGGQGTFTRALDAIEAKLRGAA